MLREDALLPFFVFPVCVFAVFQSVNFRPFFGIAFSCPVCFDFIFLSDITLCHKISTRNFPMPIQCYLVFIYWHGGIIGEVGIV